MAALAQAAVPQTPLRPTKAHGAFSLKKRSSLHLRWVVHKSLDDLDHEFRHFTAALTGAGPAFRVRQRPIQETPRPDHHDKAAAVAAGRAAGVGNGPFEPA
jgi:hypothetical protein